MKKFLVISIFLATFLLIIGCGVSNQNLIDVEKRIEALASKGFPDSALSNVRVFLYQARDAKQRGNFNLAQKAKKSMFIHIEQAEQKYNSDIDRIKPWIQSQKSKIAGETRGLSGLNKRHADSTIAVVDSFLRIGWVLHAEARLKEFSKVVPQLLSDENSGHELRKKIPGRWISEQVTKHVQDKSVYAVEKKIFNFKKDGNVDLVETKKGKSSPFFKEDWEFLSSGKYDVKGDTILLFIERFKAAKQNFWEKRDVDGKKKWVFKQEPTYDSAITDGSQDRFIIYNDLTLDFTRR
jgi:hypothetical protein